LLRGRSLTHLSGWGIARLGLIPARIIIRKGWIKVMKERILRLLKEEDGMESVEYAVVAALIILVGMAVWLALGSKVSGRVSELTSFVGWEKMKEEKARKNKKTGPPLPNLPAFGPRP
jgi:Flp pilus assembly pilin Flp